MRNWIDITVTVEPGMARWPTEAGVAIERRRSRDGIDKVSRVCMAAHTGTHIDAPLHVIPGGAAIDRMPLDATVGQAKVIAIRDRRRITEEELGRHRIREGERVLFKTSNSRFWGSARFRRDYVYVSPGAAGYLVRCGVRCVGIDYLSTDGYGLPVQAHRTLLGAGVWLIEGLDLSRVAPGAYELVCLPLKLRDSDGSPARAAVRRRAAHSPKK